MPANAGIQDFEAPDCFEIALDPRFREDDEQALEPWQTVSVAFNLPCKPPDSPLPSFRQATDMSTLVVSSKGQIVLPAALRRRLGMGAGARLEVVEEADGLKLRVVRPVVSAEIEGLAGMVRAPGKGVARTLEDFDPASLLTRSREP